MIYNCLHKPLFTAKQPVNHRNNLLTAHYTDECPFGSYGDHTTATCQQCEKQNKYNIHEHTYIHIICHSRFVQFGFWNTMYQSYDWWCGCYSYWCFFSNIVSVNINAVMRYQLRQKKRSYDVAEPPVVGGVIKSNPVFDSNVEGEFKK